MLKGDFVKNVINNFSITELYYLYAPNSFSFHEKFEFKAKV